MRFLTVMPAVIATINGHPRYREDEGFCELYLRLSYVNWPSDMPGVEYTRSLWLAHTRRRNVRNKKRNQMDGF